LGRRSRKRLGEIPLTVDDPVAGSDDAGTSRAERDEARRRRARAARSAAAAEAPRRSTARRGAERPAAPWGRFPLTELVVLLGIVLAAVGLINGGARGGTMIAAGIALICLAGLEISIREHFAGFRSHSSLLAGAAAMAVMLTVVFAGGSGSILIYQVLLAGVLVFGGSFWALRRTFRRRSGGLSFR